MPSSNDAEIEKISKDLVNQFAAIIKTSQIHDPSNVAVVSAIQKFVAKLKTVFPSAGDITLEFAGEYFYVNETRVKVAMEYIINFDYLGREFKKLKIGSITFTPELSIDDMKSFLKIFISASFSTDPFTELSEGSQKIRSISIGVPRRIKEETEEGDFRKTVKHTYFSAVSFTKGVMNKIKAGEKINAKRAKRVVQSMVDMLLEHDDFLLGMTAIKDYDDYTYHHCVNVSVLSMALGQKLGLNKQALLDLGLVALFHDIGKTEVPAEVLNKPSSFTEEEWKIIRKHPIWGVRAILKMKGFDMLSIKAAIVAYEHHIRLDKSGYPIRKYANDLDLYSRIVSLSDQYDGMTSARVYSRTPMTPEKALSLMMERAGTQLDPLLFKFFVNMVGVYPVGTAVLLNTRELALVYSNNPILPDKPNVMLITDSKGNKIQGRLVDLTEKDDSGHFKWSIVKTMDPNKYKINLAEYMM